ncbi:hypothetical protein MC885_005590, partial [Smutsia gigantea]
MDTLMKENVLTNVLCSVNHRKKAISSHQCALRVQTRLVYLYKHDTEHSLGLYRWDGFSLRRETPHGLEKVPGILYPRLFQEVWLTAQGYWLIMLGVNSIEVSGKSFHQVINMMITNSCNLIMTARQVNPENNVGNSRVWGSSSQSTANSLLGYPQLTEPDTEPKDEDSDDDIITEDMGVPQMTPKAVLTTK